jgi:hypothetical protein
MESKFEVKVDLNQALEHPKSSKFTKGMLWAVLVIIFLFTALTIYQSVTGNHVKTPIFESSPKEKTDTQALKGNTYIDSSIHIDNGVHVNHQSGDIVTGKKTVLIKK